MIAYLELYQDYWPQILKPEDHRHEVGEDKSGCINCRMNAVAEKMSDFESSAYNWYFGNVSRFALETGLVADLIRAEGMMPAVLRIFLMAMNKLHVAIDRITSEQARAEAEKG